MARLLFSLLAIFAFFQFSLGIVISPSSFAQDWKYQVKQRGILRVVDLFMPSVSVIKNYAEGLMTLDKDNNWVPCLAQDLRWIDERTIEFKLRKGVTFHNGKEFNAEAVKVNWEEYRKMKTPRPFRFLVLPDETTFEIIDKYRVRFTFPEPIALPLVKFSTFF